MKTFLKFGFVGVINTLITIISFMLLVYLGIHYMLANMIAYAIGVINSFYWNKNWVFEAKDGNKQLFTKFVIVNLITLGINSFALYLFVNYLQVLPYVAQIIATGIGLCINFLLNKQWTFKKVEG